MKSSRQMFAVGALTVVAMWAASCATQSQSSGNLSNSATQSSKSVPPRSTQAAHGAANHAHGPGETHDAMHGGADSKRVPAHYASAANIGVLPATLAPDQFSGRTREGYQAARAIPKTLAQLPCYCYCDRGFGHKSLHSCFEDTHGAHCGICVEEAVLAYKLEKEQGFSPAEIRAAVMKRFAPQ